MEDTKTEPIKRRETLLRLLKPDGRKVGLALLVSLLIFGLLGAGALIPGHCGSSLWVKIPCFGPLQFLLFMLFSFVGAYGVLVLSVCLVAAIYAGVCLRVTPLELEERQWLSGLAWAATVLFVLLTLGLVPLNQILDRYTADCTLADTLPANGRPPAQASLIAYSSRDDLGTKIFLINANGSGQRRLAGNPGRAVETTFSWSPDGYKILFDACYGECLSGPDEIYLSNILTNSTCRVVVTGPHLHNLAWAHDSAHLLYYYAADHYSADPGFMDEDLSFYSILPDGSDKTVSLEGQGPLMAIQNPSWSPDGTQLGFFGLQMLVLTASGLERKPVSLAGNVPYDPSKPASDTRLVFGTLGAIDLTRLDGTAYDLLTHLYMMSTHPQLSPDGKTIVLETSESNRNMDIYRVDSDGKNFVRLTDNPTTDERAAWSPDGEKIVFSSNRSGRFQIYIMNADGSKQIRLTLSESEDSAPMWQP